MSKKYPVISIQKAAIGFFIDINTFYAINNNFFNTSEQGNVKHEYSSVLGDINFVNNKVFKFDVDADTNG